MTLKNLWKLNKALIIVNTLSLSDSPSDIVQAAKLLKNSEIVAFPTETVYGLGACIFDETAVRKIFAAKGRPSDNPLIAHICKPEQASELALNIPKEYWILSEIFFPGPLTIVLQRHENVSKIVSAGLSTIAIRMPDHLVALALIEQTGQPLVAPSANLSGRPSPTNASHVIEDLDGKIAAIIDGGSCSIGIESTVLLIDESRKRTMILRPGSISKEEISDTLQCDVEYADKSDAAASPGMRYRHYAPKAKITLINSLENYDAKEERVILLASSEPEELPNNFEYRRLNSMQLYAELRRADYESAAEIAILLTPDILAQEGLTNRIKKAAGIY